MNEIKLERAFAWLEETNINKITSTYRLFKEEEGFSKIVSNNEILSNNGILTIPLYVKTVSEGQQESVKSIIKELKHSHLLVNSSMETLFVKLQEIGI